MNPVLSSTILPDANTEFFSWENSSDPVQQEAYKRINTVLQKLKEQADPSELKVDLSGLHLVALPSFLFIDPRFSRVKLTIDNPKLLLPYPDSPDVRQRFTVISSTSSYPAKLETLKEHYLLPEILSYLPVKEIKEAVLLSHGFPRIEQCLTTLTLGTQEGLLLFLETLKQSPITLVNLSELSLRNVTLSEEYACLIGEKCPNIKKLNLNDHHKLTDEEMGYLAKYLTKVQHLNLYSCFLLSDEALRQIALFQPSLRTLHLSSCPQITDHGLLYLAQHLKTLEHLVLPGSQNITDRGLEHLVQHSIPIRHLVLWNTQNVSDEGMALVARLPNLVCLELHFFQHITDRGLSYLSLSKGLEYLKLTNCSLIRNAGVEHLASLRSLRRLYLCACPGVTDEGLEALARTDSLEHLSLTFCSQLTNKGLRYIERTQNLQHLAIHQCNRITDAGVDRLQKALPYLDIDKTPPDNTCWAALKRACRTLW